MKTRKIPQKHRAHLEKFYYISDASNESDKEDNGLTKQTRKKKWRETEASGHVVQGGVRLPLLIQADGAESHPLPAEGGRFTLKELQNFVGGEIELLRIRPKVGLGRCWLIVNDKGRLYHLPPNRFASMLRGDLIVGDVVVIPDSMFRPWGM
ncbi:DUF3846 domain-containing protein [Frigoriglobus tundricola]|uniref:DUF3846 domain-containing protein n=1 Tax=Frigoriglobus tundricola TaxID=2774151 RepID=A0A6M5YJT5_9BACT|nr:DUF3846 domain-containing protein [Frigoriglobus tundricola]QJW93242.1 hypothetical protein FTUN_0747 [Frigoriglobus tundricola]